MGGLEFERWSVDAGPGPHLLLHLNRTEIEDLPETPRVRHQSREDIARFLGRAVMEGWSPPSSSSPPSAKSGDFETLETWPPRQETYVLRPRIDAQKWAEEREISTTMRPVLRRCRVLILAGQLKGPQDVTEPFEQVLLDPGIHAPLESIESKHLMEWTPSLNEVEAGSHRDRSYCHTRRDPLGPRSTEDTFWQDHAAHSP